MVFKFKQEPPKRKRKSPKKRYFEPETVMESDNFTNASSDSDDHSEKLFKNVNYAKNTTQTCDSYDLLKIRKEGLKKENEILQNLHSKSIVRVRLPDEENSNLQNFAYKYQNLSKMVNYLKRQRG